MTIIDVLQDFNVPYCTADQGHRHVRAGWLGLECFQCSPGSGKFKLGINLTSLGCSCWSCGTFKLSDVLAEVLHIPPKEAGKLAYQLRGSVEITPRIAQVKQTGTLVLPSGVGELMPPHRRYLEKRGFNPDKLVKLWKLGGIGLTKLAWRIFIPVLLNDEIVSWTTRSLSDDIKERYITASPDQEKVHHKSILLGEDYVRHAVVICEGPFDVFRIGPGSVCTFGTNYSQEQVRRLTSVPLRVICFDSEPQAQRQAKKLMDELAVWPGETFNVVLTSAKDPAAADAGEITELRQRFLE